MPSNPSKQPCAITGIEAQSTLSSRIHNSSFYSISQDSDSDDTVIWNTDFKSDADYLDTAEGHKQKRNRKDKTEQMRSPLLSLAQACDRVGVSSRGAAFIACAVLEDINIISKGDQSKVIDKNKIQSERKKNRLKMQHLDHENIQILEGLYFDGRKDTTFVIDTNEGKNIR